MDNLQLQHTNRQYEEELRAVRGNLLKMGGLVERQIAEAMESLVNRDTVKAREIIARDTEVIGSTSRPTSSVSGYSRCISRPPATSASSPPGSRLPLTSNASVTTPSTSASACSSSTKSRSSNPTSTCRGWPRRRNRC
jgi:hypothetical protein